MYRQTRARLPDELGIDPGPELHDLELAILRNDPDLRTPRPNGQRRDAVQLDVPALLPPSIADFAGRTERPDGRSAKQRCTPTSAR